MGLDIAGSEMYLLHPVGIYCPNKVEIRVGGMLEAGKCLWNRWSGVLGACLLAALAIYFLGGRFTTVKFDRESIDVEVEDGLIHVHGLYHYQNDSRLPALLTLATPFPVDADHPAPEAFMLAEMNRDGRRARELSLRGPREAPHVRLLFRPREGKWILLDYWQPAAIPQGCYILSTTRAWRRPIAQASFRLLLPTDYHLATSNYPMTEIPGARQFTAFTFSRTNFFPDQDWRFSWQQGQVAAARPMGGVR